jgi:hypothetical protein
MKTYCGSRGVTPLFLTAAIIIDGGEWSVSSPGRFIPDTRWIGGWVDPGVVNIVMMIKTEEWNWRVM